MHTVVNQLLPVSEAGDMCHVYNRDKAQRAGRVLCAQMKELMQRQMYEVVIQAAASGKVVARETLKAFRKNVLAKCYGVTAHQLSP